MKAQTIPFETPWLATYDGQRMVLNDEPGYRTWLPQTFGAGERAMVIVIPLASDQPRFHAAAFRYYWSTVLPIIAEDMGELNLEKVHEELCRMLLPPRVIAKKRGKGFTAVRRSTSMEAMDGPTFCEFLDRVITWACHPDERNLDIPMADPDWKWRRHYDELQRGTSEASTTGGMCTTSHGIPAGVNPASASGVES